MTIGDWVQAIVGVIGVIITVIVAMMVRGLERGDRRLEQSEERQREARKAQEEKEREARKQREEAEQERRRQREKAEREAREVRRFQHQDDYQAAKKALNALDEIFEQVTRSLFTEEQIKSAKVYELGQELEAIGRRVERLFPPLSAVLSATLLISATGLPARWEYASAFLKIQTGANVLRGDDTRYEDLMDIVQRSVSYGIVQFQAAEKGIRDIKAAREAIAKEWGS